MESNCGTENCNNTLAELASTERQAWSKPELQSLDITDAQAGGVGLTDAGVFS